MHKCEHNEKISIFCASDCCVWKEAGGCPTCIKKYHNHMGQTLFLKEDEVQNIVKKLIIDPNSKPKCRVIQQQIYNYFATIKNELINSIQLLCKTIINQLGYPFLNRNNNLFAFKRLKNKQYKKINQKDFRNLYLLSKKIDIKQVAKQENKIYLDEINKNQVFLQQLQGLMKQFETTIKKISPNFSHQSNFIKKIYELMNQVLQNASKSSNKQTNLKKYQSTKEEKIQNDQMSSPIHKLKNLSNQSNFTPSKHLNHQNLLLQPEKQKPTKDHYREVSLDKKVNQKKKFNLLLDQIKFEENSSKVMFNTQRQNSVQNYSSQKGPDTAGGSRKQFFNKEEQINSRKQKLIQMMKIKEISIINQSKVEFPKFSLGRQKTNSIQKKDQTQKQRSSSKSKQNLNELSKGALQKKQKQESPMKNYFDLNNSAISEIMKQSSNASNSLDSESQVQYIKKMIPSVNMYAHSKLPIDDHQEKLKQIAVQKLIVVPAFRDARSRVSQCDSPLLKKKHQAKNYHPQNYSLKLQPFEKVMSKSLQQNYSCQQQSPTKSIHIEIKQNQQKSLALLLKSINLKASQAIAYLQASLKYAPNNLSAAQYLTFLYLQNGNALQCLHVCNGILDKFQTTKDLEVLFVNLNNNKSAALNILGRYSQAIVILEKTLKVKQKQTLFKNLGDAYFLNGNLQKSIFNYQKAIKMQSNYDQAYYNLAACLYTQQNYNNAKIWINIACQLCPKKTQYAQLKRYIDERIKKSQIQF